MNTALAPVIAENATAIVYTDKKGALHAVSPEFAIFKGGIALAGTYDPIVQSCLKKALDGNYFKAGDLVNAVYPTVFKNTEKFIKDDPRRTKINFLTLVGQVLGTKPKDGKAYSVKQAHVQDLCKAWMASTVPASQVVETVDAVAA